MFISRDKLVRIVTIFFLSIFQFENEGVTRRELLGSDEKERSRLNTLSLQGRDYDMSESHSRLKPQLLIEVSL